MGADSHLLEDVGYDIKEEDGADDGVAFVMNVAPLVADDALLDGNDAARAPAPGPANDCPHSIASYRQETSLAALILMFCLC